MIGTYKFSMLQKCKNFISKISHKKKLSFLRKLLLIFFYEIILQPTNPEYFLSLWKSHPFRKRVHFFLYLGC